MFALIPLLLPSVQLQPIPKPTTHPIRFSVEAPALIHLAKKPDYDVDVLIPLHASQQAKADEEARLAALEAARLAELQRLADEAARAAQVAYTAPVTVSGNTDVQAVIVKWANYYGADANWLLRIAACESGFNPNAVAPNIIDGGHPTGLFQHVSTYWPSRAARYGVPGASIFDAEAQARVTAGMFADGQSSQWECH